jgi:Zn-dependent protease with chaperone function
MPFLLLLVLTLICIQGSWPQPRFGLDIVGATAMTWTGVVVFLVLAAILARYFSRHLRGDPAGRQVIQRRFSKYRRRYGQLLIAFYILALYVFGWGWVIKGDPQLDVHPVPGAELIILAPFLTALIFSWALFYTMERASHDSAPLLRDDEPFPGRWAYVLLQVRQNLLLVFPPVLLLLIQQTVLWLFPALQENGFFLPIFAVALLACVFIGIPYVLRLLLGLRPLPPGPLRERLLATAQRLHFRCNDILLWNTRNGMANAMVTGPLPILRYVVLTDRLVREMAPEEVEAVFGHEIGHIKHHHMLFYFGFLVASLVVVASVFEVLQENVKYVLADRAPELDTWLQSYQFLGVLPMVALLGTYVFVVFGFLSRRCERQADIHGCRTVSAPVFIEALEKVARLNGISRDRPGWLSSWQHSTIARRVAFLQQMCADPALELRFQRRVWLIKWTVLFVLAVVILTLLGVLGGERLWKIVSTPGPTTTLDRSGGTREAPATNHMTTLPPSRTPLTAENSLQC